MDLKKDQESGRYSITQIIKTDPSYDLNGLIFEFTRADQSDLHYFIEHLTKDEFCAMDDEEIEEKENFCEDWKDLLTSSDKDGNPCVPTFNIMKDWHEQGEKPEPT